MFYPRLIENFLLSFLLCFLAMSVCSQQSIKEVVTPQIKHLSSINKISLFEEEDKKILKNLKTKSLLKDYNLLSLKSQNLSNLISAASESINVDLPIGDEVKTLKLTKANIFAPGFKVRKASNPNEELNINLGLNYRGTIDDEEKSIVSISFVGKEVVGSISYKGSTYNLGKLKDENHHILYRESDFDYENKYTCHTDDNIKIGDRQINTKQLKSHAVDNCVSVYIETEFDVYQERGSVTSVTNYITSLFGQVSTLYANESINLLISEILVWDTEDPYTGNSSTLLLNEFMDRLDGDFNGDIAHLINFEQNGGIAYVDALCSPFAYGTSGIDNFFSNVPTYSWSVGLLAHEIGHNLGSPHTHACVWNGNNTAIDGCGDDGDGCSPGPIPNAGTIMSYCHLRNDVGIDLSLGFGQQPGDLIRATVAGSSCLAVCGDCEDEGNTCNDGDPCTTNDRINAACSCVGTLVDVDLDGVCSTEDPDDNDPCTPNACPTCTNIVITVILDNRPNETSWEIRGESGQVLITSGTGYGNFPKGSTVTSRLCASDACYTFVMKDKFGDGLCCGQGQGSYTVAIENGPTLITGGEFEDEDLNDFCIDSNSSECSGPCDDGDPCTTNDQYQSNCDCEGTPKADSDNDGICNDLDDCPNLDNSLIGTTCNDGDPCTTNDRYNDNCECAGTPKADSDNDGICNDLDDCPNLNNNLIGTICNDGDPCTTNDRYNDNCECAGTPKADSDNDGICNDLDNCPELDNSLIGTSCDDGDPCTANDKYQDNCNCEGTPKPDSDGDGVCDDLDNCSLVGNTCNDGDPCTTNDRYDSDCMCVGVAKPDSDNDGVCDDQDSCPDLNNSLIGTICNDGDPCTTGERYNTNCECAGGTMVDADGDGVCASEDANDNDPCIPNECGECTEVTVYVTLDNYPGETRWNIRSKSGEVLLQSPRYFSRDRGTTQTSTICLNGGCYDFNITDSFGDGICCFEGDGDYRIVTKSGAVLASGGEFGRSEKKEICINGSTGECSGSCDDGDECTTNDRYDSNCNCIGDDLPDSDNDGICDSNDICPNLQNNLIGQPCNDGDDCTIGETYSGNSCDCQGGRFVDEDNDGVCVGDDPDDNNPCVPDNSGNGCSTDLNCTTDNFADFESSWGVWRSGGSDASRARFAAYANSGDICIRLRDNTDESTLTTDALSFANVNQVKVTFSYYALSMDNSAEDFWLQLSTDGRRTFKTVEEWNKNDEFQNNRRYEGVAIVPGPFTNQTHLRFRCDASNNADIVFIDDIRIERCNTTAGNLGSSFRSLDEDQPLDFTVFPNPVQQSENLRLAIRSGKDKLKVTVFDILGKQLTTNIVERQDFDKSSLNTSNLKSGTYLIKVESDSEFKIKKVVVMR